MFKSAFALIIGICVCVSSASKFAQYIVNDDGTVERDTAGDNFHLIVFKEKLSWFAARGYCEKRNMTLVSLETEEKFLPILEFLQFLRAKNLIDKEKDDEDCSFWTSGTDQLTKGVFAWQNSGETFTYENWLPGMPNIRRIDGQCVAMNLRKFGKWRTIRCHHRHHFICQKKMDPVKNVTIVDKVASINSVNSTTQNSENGTEQYHPHVFITFLFIIFVLNYMYLII